MALELKERAVKRLVRDQRTLTAEAGRARLLLREVAEILEQIDEEAATWIAENIPKAYLRGVRNAELGLSEIGLKSLPKIDPAIHREAIQALVDTAQDTLAEAGEGVRKGYQRLVRRTQLTAILDKKITEQTALGVGAGKARREVSKAMLQTLVDELGEKPLVINGRHYDPKKYAELVARTQTADASKAGLVTRMVDAGEDLVMVTAHGATDACGPFEGKVFSISGTSEKYPALDRLPNGGPPFHPNCKHRLAPFIEDLASGAEKRRGAGLAESNLDKPYAQLEKEHRKAA